MQREREESEAYATSDKMKINTAKLEEKNSECQKRNETKSKITQRIKFRIVDGDDDDDSDYGVCIAFVCLMRFAR